MYDPLIAKRKQYVTVTAMHYVNGFTCPQILETEDGAFLIEHVKKVQKLSGRDGTGADERFLIILMDKEKYLYREGQRWFIIKEKDDYKIFGSSYGN